MLKGKNKECKHCKKIFYVHPYRINENNFCSRFCYYTYRKPKEKICLICNKKFRSYSKTSKYCSYKCYNQFKARNKLSKEEKKERVRKYNDKPEVRKRRIELGRIWRKNNPEKMKIKHAKRYALMSEAEKEKKKEKNKKTWPIRKSEGNKKRKVWYIKNKKYSLAYATLKWYLGILINQKIYLKNKREINKIVEELKNGTNEQRRIYRNLKLEA